MGFRKPKISSFQEKIDDVATGSYNVFMSSEIKSVGIRELKNNLSAYLKDVRSGVRLLICDRNQVIAQISKVSAEDISLPDDMSSLLSKWSEEKVVSLPKDFKKQGIKITPVSLPEGTSARLLDAERGED